MKSTLAGVGTVGAALLAHLPCCGSSVLLAFGGIGVSAGWLEALAPYRGWLVAFSLLTLGVGFWTAYRKPHACHSCGECSTEVHAKRRVRIGAMWAVAAVSLGLLVVGQVNEMSHAGHDHGPGVYHH